MLRRHLIAISLVLVGEIAFAQDRAIIHRIVEVEGDVQIQRAGWSGVSRVGFGTPVGNGDRFRMAPGSRAKIVCSDSAVMELPMRRVSPQPCRQKADVALWWKGSPINGTRKPVNALIVLVVAPRATAVLSPEPIIRWQAVEGAAQYRVSVADWTSPIIAKTETRYPESAPPLNPETGYRAVVTIVAPQSLAGISSADDQTPGLGFTVLKPDEAKRIRMSELGIQRLDISETAKKLLVSDLYANAGLKSEALAVLEDLFSKSSNSAVALMLGKLYDQVSLPQLAETWYRKAFQLAVNEDRIEPQAQSLEGIAFIIRDLRGRKAADQFVSQAIDKYRALGSQNDEKRLRDEFP